MTLQHLLLVWWLPSCRLLLSLYLESNGSCQEVIDMLFGWRNLFGNHRSSLIRNAAPICLMRTILHEKNKSTFNDVELSIFEIKSLFLTLVFEWPYTSGGTNAHYIVEFIHSLSFSNVIVEYCDFLSKLCVHEVSSFG